MCCCLAHRISIAFAPPLPPFCSSFAFLYGDKAITMEFLRYGFSAASTSGTVAATNPQCNSIIMAKVKPSIIEESGSIGDRVFYTRFGKTFSRRRPTDINDQKSEAQLRQRALFKAMQHTASFLGSAIQRGLAREAHSHGRVENNEFVKINKQCFVYEDGTVRIDYPRLLLATGPIARVNGVELHCDGLHIDWHFAPRLNDSHARPDDIVHIYAVEPDIEICELVASVERQTCQTAFDLPDLSDDPGCKTSPTFHLYAIVEAASTACIPTLSPAEKRTDKNHRNINRRVSPSIFIGTIMLGSEKSFC